MKQFTPQTADVNVHSSAGGSSKRKMIPGGMVDGGQGFAPDTKTCKLELPQPMVVATGEEQNQARRGGGGDQSERRRRGGFRGGTDIGSAG